MIGRFQTQDTWGGDENKPITFNSWQYANSNPIMYTDPSGHIACGDIIPSWRPIFKVLKLCNPNEEPTGNPKTIGSAQNLENWIYGNSAQCGIGYTEFGLICAPIIVRDNQCGGDVSGLLPGLSQLTPSEPRYCSQLWEQWATAAVNAQNITDLIRRARIELLETIDPEKRRYIELKILAWQKQLAEAEKTMIKIKDAARAAGCDISSWYL